MSAPTRSTARLGGPHPERIRLPLLAFWCAPREAEVVDGLVELLIQVTHRITVKAERRVLEELVEEAAEVRGKAGILFRVAEAAVDRPEGVVREVIFPAAGQSTLEALVREARALGTPHSRRVHTAVRASYGSYYRRMMPKLLAALDFRSNNGAHRPLIDALEAIRRRRHADRLPFLAGARHHGLPGERRAAGARAGDGGTCQRAHNEALRPPRRGGLAR
ncbi:MAG: hypothetical protein K2X49_29680 [Acetobacteraceae bacterium]|nr:hypothetical protein [Acetobacteraceae bacterium]